MAFRTVSLIALTAAFVIVGAGSSMAAATRDAKRPALKPGDSRVIPFVRERFRARFPRLEPGQGIGFERRPVLFGGETQSLVNAGEFIEPKLRPSDERALARVTLPLTADGPFSVTDLRSGRRAAIRLLDTRPVASRLEDGIVVYERAVNGGTWLHRVTHAGTEDFVLFRSRTETTNALHYELRPERALPGLRLVGNTLEMLDSTGNPKLRASPPWLIDSNGTVREAKLSVLDCAFDTSTVAPWGRAITPRGAETCTVRVSWEDRDLVYPILVDPSWSSTASMSAKRAYFTLKGAGTGALLLAAGGWDIASSAILSSAEIYCVGGVGCTAGTWSTTGSMATARAFHAAVAYPELSGSGFVFPSNQVMVIGGANSSGYLSSCETFTGSTGTWTSAPSMATARALPVVARYDTGKFLAAGGMNSSLAALSTVEGFHWSATPAWSALPSMGTRRTGHTATSLFTTSPWSNQGQSHVLVAGGHDHNGALVSVARRYEPSSNTWVDAGSMATAVYAHTATQVLAGTYQYDVFVGGGHNGSQAVNVLQRYNRTTATWTTSAGSVFNARYGHTASLLSDNQTILFVSGKGVVGAIANSYGYNTHTNTGTLTNFPGSVAGRVWHAGTGVMVGGANGAESASLDSAALYTP